VITVALPAYNEEEALPPLLDALAEVRQAGAPDIRVFVVDDGSADSTAEVVRRYHSKHPWIELVPHERNMGLSQAIQTGFQRAIADSAPDDIVITLDADNTQPPDHIPGMVKRIREEGLDVVIASRFQPGAEVHGVPPLRRLYSQVMGILFKVVLPIRGVRDYSCGYRAYRASALQRAYQTFGERFITEQGFSCMVEILLQLNRLKLRFGEVPMILRYDLKPTETKMRVGRTIRDTLRLAMRYRFVGPAR